MKTITQWCSKHFIARIYEANNPPAFRASVLPLTDGSLLLMEFTIYDAEEATELSCMLTTVSELLKHLDRGGAFENWTVQNRLAVTPQSR
jgi:hypothetical protein